MTVANRGTKRRCPHCGAPYYDLCRSPVVCPKCQTPYVEAQRVPMRATRARPEAPLPAEEPADDAAAFDEDESLDNDEIDSDILRDEEDEGEGEDRE